MIWMLESTPLGIPPPVHNCSLGRQTEFCECVQPAWYTQVLNGASVFPAGLSLSCIPLVPHWMWWNQRWPFCQRDRSASHSTGLFLPSISTRYDSAWNTPCVLPLPHTKIVSVFSGSTYKPAAIFDASANSKW